MPSYPDWKKVVWSVVRFVGNAILATMTTDVIMKALQMDPEYGKKYLIAIALGGLTTAITKYLRSKSLTYDSLVHKLPL